MACFPCQQYNLDCYPRCAFLELFSQLNQRPQFEAVEFVFGFDKVRRMMQEVPEEKRQDYIKSIVVEANHRWQYPTSGFTGIARKKIQELLNEKEEAKRKISPLQQEKSEGLGKISQLQGENAEALGKILLLQREKEEAIEKIQRLLKEKEESKRATEDQILQLRQTLKEDFEKYLIRIEQLFHQQATDSTTQAYRRQEKEQRIKTLGRPPCHIARMSQLLIFWIKSLLEQAPLNRWWELSSLHSYGPNKTTSRSHGRGLRWIYRFL